MTDLSPSIPEYELTTKLDELRDIYGDRMKKVLLTIKEELERFSWCCSTPHNMDNGEYALIVSREKARVERGASPEPQDLEVYARIMDSRSWDGTRGGIAFNIDVTSFAGDVLGGFVPVSFTGTIWVPVEDEEQVEAKMQELEKIDPHSMVRLLQRWQKGRTAR